MKKNFNLLLALFSLMVVFASCSDDDDMGGAVVKFDADKVSVIDGTTLSPSAITGSIKVTTEDAKIDALNIIAVYSDNSTASLATESKKGNVLTEVSKGNYTFRIDAETTGIKDKLAVLTKITISGNVKDGDPIVGEKAIEQTTSATDLSEATAFVWKRSGASASEGLAKFGLDWKENTVSAAIVTTNTNTVLVELTASEWTSITTKEALATAIKNATPLTKVELTLGNSTSLNKVLAVDAEGKGDFYLIHITKSTDENTVRTFEGEYKN